MRILIRDGRPSDEPHDIVVLPGNVAGYPVKAIPAAAAAFPRPVVLVAGSTESTGGTVDRKLAEGRRQAKKRPGMHFLEEEMVVIGGVRFIGASTPSGLVAAALLDPPFKGPTVAITHTAPAEATSLFRPDIWIYGDVPDVDNRHFQTRLVRKSGLVVDVGLA